MAVGVATFAASAGAGVLWMLGGPAASFVAGAAIAAAAGGIVFFQPSPRQVG
jgi:hypothetical protein